jgi:zinc transporter, ZIP family
MLADTLLPEAYAVEGLLTGPLVVTGFAVSLALSAIRAATLMPSTSPRPSF